MAYTVYGFYMMCFRVKVAVYYDSHNRLDDGWPESVEEHVTLLLISRECKEYIQDIL